MVLRGTYSLALLSRLDPPECSSGGFPDGQAAVQQHGAESPHGIPLQEPRDGVSLLHHPGNAGTRKLPHVRTGTLQLQETWHRRVSHLYFRLILRHRNMTLDGLKNIWTQYVNTIQFLGIILQIFTFMHRSKLDINLSRPLRIRNLFYIQLRTVASRLNGRQQQYVSLQVINWYKVSYFLQQLGSWTAIIAVLLFLDGRFFHSVHRQSDRVELRPPEFRGFTFTHFNLLTNKVSPAHVTWMWSLPLYAVTDIKVQTHTFRFQRRRRPCGRLASAVKRSLLTESRGAVVKHKRNVKTDVKLMDVCTLNTDMDRQTEIRDQVFI